MTYSISFSDTKYSTIKKKKNTDESIKTDLEKQGTLKFQNNAVTVTDLFIQSLHSVYMLMFIDSPDTLNVI